MKDLGTRVWQTLQVFIYTQLFLLRLRNVVKILVYNFLLLPQEPRGREVELEYKIMSTSTTNDNQFKWHKKKKALTNETQAAMSA